MSGKQAKIIPSFEKLAFELSDKLIGTSDSGLDEGVRSALSQIGDFFGLTRVVIWGFPEAGSELRILSSWSSTDFDPKPQLNTRLEFPWRIARLLEGKSVVFSDLDELPEEAEIDRASWMTLGVRSHLSLPLQVGGSIMGALSLGDATGRVKWDGSTLDSLRLVGNLMASALARRTAYQELSASEERYRSYVAHSSEGTWCMEFGEPVPLALPEEAALTQIFETGRMVEFNDVFAQMYGFESAKEMADWRLDERLEDKETSREFLLTAVRAKYECRNLISKEIHNDGTTRYFSNNFFPQFADGKLYRVWGTQVDVTATFASEELARQQKSELDQLRSQLTHLSRVATLGELSAAIAHELNQPLTGIGSNASAARNFLKTEKPDLAEIGAILDDIGNEAQRAAQVIRGMRGLFGGQESPRSGMDLNEAVRQVAMLLNSDAVLRKVSLDLELREDLPTVNGDAIQVQQVLMNLILNGWDAMAELEPAAARLEVSTTCLNSDAVLVSVRDRGCGFRGNQAEELFEPFCTSKREGMGMGLAIARSIIEGHGGRIWGEEHPDKGTTFFFTLPILRAGST